MPLPDARLLDVADAIVAIINGADIKTASGLSFTAERSYSTAYTDSELSTIRVNVVPDDLQREASRATEVRFYTVRVVVQKFVARKNLADIDPLFNLAVAIADAFPLDGQMTVGAADVGVVENRPMPLFLRTTTIMEVPTAPNTRFRSEWLLRFREEVAT